ncbi:MAG: helix-turn-helix domain-containing protein [Myxococcota bacterium]
MPDTHAGRSEPPAALTQALALATRPVAEHLGRSHPVVRGLALDEPPPERRIPVALLDVLWDAVVQRDGAAAVLALGEGVRASSFGLLTYLLGCAPSGTHAVRRLAAAFGPLLSEGTEYRVAVDRRHVEVVVRLNGGARSTGAALFAMASVVGFVAGEVEGAPRPQTTWVDAPVPAPGETEAFARFFRGPVHYAAGTSRLVYARADLERRLRGSDPALAELLEEAARRRCSAPRPTVEAVEAALLAAGPEALGSQASVAATLGWSPRSLRRRLADEGARFQDVVDGMRRRWAEAWLSRPDTSVKELAARLGYADAAAFRRAFRRWTGTSPSTWGAALRRAHAPGATAVSKSATSSTSSSSTSMATQLRIPSPATSA